MRADAAVELTVSDLHDGFVSDRAPRLSWRTTGVAPYGDGVAVHAEATRAGRVEHAAVDASDSVLRPWPFAEIEPRERVSVRVRVAVDACSEGVWSAPVVVTGGVLDTWDAGFLITGTDDPGLLRRAFAVPEDVVRGTLYVSAFGAARPHLNGHVVGDRELAPGWTSYQWRVDYDTYDVSSLLVPGGNALGLELSGAWYTERYGFRDAAARFYEGAPAVSAFLVVEGVDGAETTVVRTDAGCRWASGGTVTSSIYQGEFFDARRHPVGWDRAEFPDAHWAAATTRPIDVVPSPRVSPPVRVTADIVPVATSPGADGATIIDFGQNLVGRLRLRINVAAGTRIELRHAEVLEGGALAIRPLRNAAATDVYIAAGGDEEWEPTGTFHGFRFAEVRGLGDLDTGQVVARVLGTDLRRIGGLQTSHPLLQKLHDNVVWSARGNFLSVPTDCPQRDERLGWTGDVEVFAPAAAFLFDCADFFRSWLADVRLEQAAAGGVVPMVVPAVIPQVPGLSEPIAAWGDAITVLPTVLHDSFADDRFLVENLDAMIAWVDAVRRRTSDAPLWEDGRQFGDWLDPDTPPDQPGKAATDPDIVATAYFQRSARLASEAAMRLGQPDIAERYSNLADRIREAFLQAYVTPSGRMMSDSPTAYALAIVFDLVDAQRRAALGDRLAELLRRRAYRIATGFVGTPIVCDALTRTGHGDVATRLLLQTENPSWLYPVTMGATTVWERWDSLLEDGSLNPGQMTSFNHFALGAVVDWMHRALGGLTAKAPGYRRARFAPLFADGIDDIAVWHDSPYGRVDASWHRTGAAVRVTLDVPEGIEIDVDLPGTQVSVGAGHHRWDVRNDAPPPAPGVPSLDGPMTDVLDSPEAYAAVFDELVRWDPDRAARLRRSIVWTAGRRLRDPLDKVPVEVMERISARLRG